MSELLTTTEVMARLKVSRTTLHRLVTRGDVPRIYILGCPRFDPRDIEAYIDRRRQPRPSRGKRAAY